MFKWTEKKTQIKVMSYQISSRYPNYTVTEVIIRWVYNKTLPQSNSDWVLSLLYWCFALYWVTLEMLRWLSPSRSGKVSLACSKNFWKFFLKPFSELGIFFFLMVTELGLEQQSQFRNKCEHVTRERLGNLAQKVLCNW